MRPLLSAIGLIVTIGCAQGVAVQRGRDFVVYRAERVRVYISSAFPRELEGYGDPAARNQILEAFGDLFRRGVLTGEMFLVAIGEGRTESAVHQYYPRRLGSVDEALAADPGPLMKLLNCNDLSAASEPTRRRYGLWVTFDATETGWGSFHHFDLVLENAKATARTPPREFTAGAQLVGLKYAGMEL